MQEVSLESNPTVQLGRLHDREEASVVRLSRFDGSEFYVNAELIEIIEMTPDTVISLTNGKKFVVRESADDVVSRVVDYKRRIVGVVGADLR